MSAAGMNRIGRPLALRKLGWLALLAFTAKGVITGSLIVWALVSATS